MCYLGLPLTVQRLHGLHLQFLINKVANEMVGGFRKLITGAGCGSLVKPVVTAQEIYHMTALILPKGITKAIIKLQRSVLQAALDKLSGGKCKVKWGLVCLPTSLGGLGILNVDKFVRAV